MLHEIGAQFRQGRVTMYSIGQGPPTRRSRFEDESRIVQPPFFLYVYDGDTRGQRSRTQQHRRTTLYPSKDETFRCCFCCFLLRIKRSSTRSIISVRTSTKWINANPPSPRLRFRRTVCRPILSSSTDPGFHEPCRNILLILPRGGTWLRRLVPRSSSLTSASSSRQQALATIPKGKQIVDDHSGATLRSPTVSSKLS